MRYADDAKTYAVENSAKLLTSVSDLNKLENAPKRCVGQYSASEMASLMLSYYRYADTEMIYTW